jgi:hypothetical protein
MTQATTAQSNPGIVSRIDYKKETESYGGCSVEPKLELSLWKAKRPPE